MARVARTAASLGLALCLGLVPPACGGSQTAELSVFHGNDGPTVPEATVSKLRACADRIRDPRKEVTYAFHFQVEVTEDGHVDRVKHKESVPVDPGIESCLAEALEGMRVPASAVEALTRQQEQAEAVSPSSRRLIGNPAGVAVAGIELARVTIVAGGVTVAVGVTLSVSEEVIETARRRRQSMREDSPHPSPRIMPLGPCERKCQDDYEDAAAVCGRMADAAQRRACQDSAYARYKRCRESCQSAQKSCTDMYEDCTDRNYSPCNTWLPKESTTMCRYCLENCQAGKPYKYKQCKQCGFSE